MNGRPNTRQQFLKMRIDGWAERKDREAESSGFVREDLVHDKRLRVAWVTLDDVSDSTTLRQTHGQGGLGRVSARRTSEEVNRL